MPAPATDPGQVLSDDLKSAMAVLNPKAAPLSTVADLLAWLPGAPVLQLYCPLPPTTDRQRHRVGLAQADDGTYSVVPMDHNRAAEEVMAALSGKAEGCLQVVRWLEGAEDLPLDYPEPRGTKMIALRRLWLAAQYLQAGWSLQAAAPFLVHGPHLPVTRQWLQQGAAPGSIAAWAGHTWESYQRWSTVSPPVTPAEAAELDNRDVAPAQVTAWAALGVPPAEVPAVVAVGLDLHQAAAWREAGVPARDLRGWAKHADAAAVPAADVPGWVAAGVHPDLFASLQQPQGRALHRSLITAPQPVTIADYRTWRAVGVPVDQVGEWARQADFTPDDAVECPLLTTHDMERLLEARGLRTSSTQAIPKSVLKAALTYTAQNRPELSPFNRLGLVCFELHETYPAP